MDIEVACKSKERKGISKLLEKCKTFVVTLIWWIVLVFDALILALILIILPDRFRNSVALRTASKLLLKVAGVKVRIHGLENVLENQPQIFVANHKSWFDSFILSAFLLVPVTFVSKKEMFKVPVYNYIMKRLRFVCVDRERARGSITGIDETIKLFDSGLSMVIYPEGTTRSTQQLGPFKRGAVLLSAIAQVPIVPIALIGTEKFRFQKGPWIHYGIQTEICIFKAIEAYSMDRLEQKDTVQYIKDIIQKRLNE